MRALVASTGASSNARLQVGVALRDAGWECSDLLLVNAQDDFSAAVGASPRSAVLLVVTQPSDVELLAGVDNASLRDGLDTAVASVSSSVGENFLVVFVGSLMLPLQVRDEANGSVAVLEVDTVEPDTASLIAEKLGVAPLSDEGANDPIASDKSAIRRHNVPPATYLAYIERKALERAEQSLRQRNTLTAVVGFGGVGKSSLATEVAHRTAHDANGLPFEAIVWVSDKDSPGSTNLGRLLDQLADVVEHPGLKSYAPEQKADRARQLCQETATLLIVDNVDTVENPELFEWLRDVPDPSRVLVTSRREMEVLENVQRVIPLRGFRQEDAAEFAQQVVERMGEPDIALPDGLVSSIWRATDGNAKAIEVALALILKGGHPSGEVLATLAEDTGELFTDLFARSWSSLDETAHRALFSISVLPFGATSDLLSKIALGTTGRLGPTLANLRQLMLVDATLVHDSQKDDEVVIFTLSSLVQAFVMSEAVRHLDMLREIRDRAVDILRTIASQAGFCPGHIHRLDVLDRPQLLRNIEATIAWCFEQERYEDVIALARDVRYYYYVRGVWSPEPDPNLMRAVAASEIGDSDEELDALLYFSNIAAKQENEPALREHADRIDQLVGRLPDNSPQLSTYSHVKALRLLALGDVDGAIDLWRENLESRKMPAADESANRRWLGVAYLRRGEMDLARRQFEEAVEFDTHAGFDRAVLSSQLNLVRIDLESAESAGASKRGHGRDLCYRASEQLTALESEVREVNDRYYRAQWLELSGRVAMLEGRQQAGVKLLELAAREYDLLGLASRRREADGRVVVGG